jgi:hypothetical protein
MRIRCGTLADPADRRSSSVVCQKIMHCNMRNAFYAMISSGNEISPRKDQQQRSPICRF